MLERFVQIATCHKEAPSCAVFVSFRVAEASKEAAALQARPVPARRLPCFFLSPPIAGGWYVNQLQKKPFNASDNQLVPLYSVYSPVSCASFIHNYILITNKQTLSPGC